MNLIRINTGTTAYTCPYCKKQLDDIEDSFPELLNCSSNGVVDSMCPECGKIMEVVADYTGKLHTRIKEGVEWI